MLAVQPGAVTELQWEGKEGVATQALLTTGREPAWGVASAHRSLWELKSVEILFA